VNYKRAYKLLSDNIDILHAMKDALMKYETIDSNQVDDLMARVTVRPPSDWDDEKEVESVKESFKVDKVEEPVTIQPEETTHVADDVDSVETTTADPEEDKNNK
jgi:cell division protease FtsH